MWPVRRIFLLIFHSPRRRLVYKDRGMVLFMCLLTEKTRALLLWIFLRWVVGLVSVLTGNIDWNHNQQGTGPDTNKIRGLKPRANGRNIVGCYTLRPFAHPSARCCVLLGVIAQSLKPVKRSATCKRAQQVPTLSANNFGSCCARLPVV